MADDTKPSEPPAAPADELVERLREWATQPNAVSQDLRRDISAAADALAALRAERDEAISERDIARGEADVYGKALDGAVQRGESLLRERDALRAALRKIEDGHRESATTLRVWAQTALVGDA